MLSSHRLSNFNIFLMIADLVLFLLCLLFLWIPDPDICGLCPVGN